MKLSDTIMDIRPRSTTELVDLAMVFYRRHLLLLFSLCAIFGVPIVLLCSAVQELSGQNWLPWVLFLLLLPLSSGAIVLAAGRIVFGTGMTVVSTLALYRNLWASFFFIRLLQKVISLALIPLIYGVVFSIERQFTPMIILLERLRGKEISLRNRVLNRHSVGSGAAFESVVTLLLAASVVSLMLLLQLMFGEMFSLWPDTGFFSEESFDDPVRTGIWMLAILAVYPVAVLSRFFRYIDARIRGEGWDLELAFRKIASEVQRRMNLSGGAVLIILMMSLPVSADEVPVDSKNPSNKNVSTQIDDITQGPAFRWLREGNSGEDPILQGRDSGSSESTGKRRHSPNDCEVLPGLGGEGRETPEGDGCGRSSEGSVFDELADGGCGCDPSGCGNGNRPAGCGCTPESCSGMPAPMGCGGCSPVGTGTAKFVGAAMAVLLLAGLIVVVIRVILLRPPPAKDGDLSSSSFSDDPLEVPMESLDHLSPEALLRRAVASAEEGDFRRAVGFAYLAGLSRMHQLEFVVLHRFMTNRRILDETGRHGGPVIELSSVVGTFEEIYFGNRQALQVDFARCEGIVRGFLQLEVQTEAPDEDN